MILREVILISRRVLFSFLGRSSYLACMYTHGKFTATLSRFIQTAIYEYLLAEEPALEVVMFVTEEADRENWDKLPNEKTDYSEMVEHEGLSNAFQRIAPELKVKKVRIPSAQDERTNWQFFDIILNEVQEEDHIFFDITHSFRSIPLISLIVLNYARFLKGATIGRIMYGSLEELGNGDYVKSLPVCKRIAPMIDFTPMVALLDWPHGINQFLRTGDASTILTLAQSEWKQVKDTVEAKDRDTIGELMNMSKKMQEVNQALQTVRARSVTDELSLLNQQVDAVEKVETGYMKPLIPLISKIKEKLSGFTDDPAEQNIFIIEWCLNHHLTQQGLTFLRESVVSACCQLCHMDELNWHERENVSKAIFCYGKPPNNWKLGKTPIEKINFIHSIIAPYQQYFPLFRRLAKIRNDINHAGMNHHPMQAKALKQELITLHKQFKPFFKKIYAQMTPQERIGVK